MTHIPSFSRRQFSTLLGGLLFLPWLNGCALQARPLTIGLHIWPGYEPLLLARALGWLDPNKIKLIENQSATHTIGLLKTGKIDGGALTLDEVLRAREMGIALSVVLVCDISAGADMLLARPNIKALGDLKGHRVAVEDGALGALMLHQVLQAAGLKAEDIQLVSQSVDQHTDAWKRGDIEAVVTYEPAASRILAMGGHKLFDSRQIPNTVIDVLAIRTELLDGAHADAARHLVAAHLKALNYINTHPDDASYRMAPDFKLPPEKVLSMFKGLVLPDLGNNRRLLATSSPLVSKSAKRVADILLKAGILHTPADLDGLLRPEYLPRDTAS